jgi:hypothetical protein
MQMMKKDSISAARIRWTFMATPGSNALFKRLNLLTAECRIVSSACQAESLMPGQKRVDSGVFKKG